MFNKKSFNEIDKTKFIQSICEKYFVVNEFVVKKFVVKKFVVIEQFVAIKLIDMQQNHNEIIKQYYQRIQNVFVKFDRNDISLFVVIRN